MNRATDVCFAVVEDGAGRERAIRTVGRFAQTLRALVKAGPAGVTALDLSSWAVRLGHYVWVLMKRHGLNIATVIEEHGGSYPGRHGRYTILDRVRIVATDVWTAAA